MGDALTEPDDKLVYWAELSVRASGCLDRAGYVTYGQVRAADDCELLRIKNFGRKSLKEVRRVIGVKT